MTGTIEQETERIANVLDGTTASGPIHAALAKWDSVITQLTAQVTQQTAQVTQQTALVTQLTNLVTQLTNAVTQLTSANGHLNTIKGDITGIHTGVDAGELTLQTVKTAIDNVNVAVTVNQSDVAEAIQTQSRSPLVEKKAMRTDIRSASVASKTPGRPGSR